MIRTINLHIHEATVGWIALHSWNECITLAPKKTSTKGVFNTCYKIKYQRNSTFKKTMLLWVDKFQISHFCNVVRASVRLIETLTAL